MSLETSTSTEKLDAALAKAQGEFTMAKKNAENPHFKSNYADLGSVWDACRASLSKHLISVTQWPIASSSNSVTVLTRIAHGGEWMMASLAMPLSKADAHGVGGAITYAKRFALGAILGVVAEGEDDDGNSAVGGGVKKPAGKPADGGPKPAGKPPESAQKPPANLPKPKGEGELKAQPKAAPASKPPAQTFKEYAESFGWTEGQAKEWAAISFKPAEGEQLTKEQFAELKRIIKTSPPVEALFMARNP